ncbi:MAG: hypothetical protein ABI954_06515 [Pyrinomonadaceae bacterium]
MNCAYHSQNLAVVQCNNCGRFLCPTCDHRIKGFPYCQECIVAGIDLLRHHRVLAPNQIAGARKGSPFLAAILSLICPGLGAAYNGQNSKALVHFGVFVGLFQMGILTNGVPLFVLGFLGMWLFAAVDAFRTARAIKSGFAPQTDDVLTRQLSGNPLVWAISLIALGALFFIHTTFGIRLPIRELLPILLVGLGVYWLINYVQRRRNLAIAPQASSYQVGLPSADETSYNSVNVTQFRSNKY